MTTLKNCLPRIFSRASVNQDASTRATTIWGTKPRIHMTKVFQAYLGRSEESREM